MKTKEELNKLKEEVESVNEKLAELTPEEIAQVNGGRGRVILHSFVHDFREHAIEPVVVEPPVGFPTINAK